MKGVCMREGDGVGSRLHDEGRGGCRASSQEGRRWGASCARRGGAGGSRRRGQGRDTAQAAQLGAAAGLRTLPRRPWQSNSQASPPFPSSLTSSAAAPADNVQRHGGGRRRRVLDVLLGRVVRGGGGPRCAAGTRMLRASRPTPPRPAPLAAAARPRACNTSACTSCCCLLQRAARWRSSLTPGPVFEQ